MYNIHKQKIIILWAAHFGNIHANNWWTLKGEKITITHILNTAYYFSPATWLTDPTYLLMYIANLNSTSSSIFCYLFTHFMPALLFILVLTLWPTYLPPLNRQTFFFVICSILQCTYKNSHSRYNSLIR